MNIDELPDRIEHRRRVAANVAPKEYAADDPSRTIAQPGRAFPVGSAEVAALRGRGA